MINIDTTAYYYSLAGYAFSILGNEGEEELVVMMSPSQARATPMCIVAISVDGGMKILHQSGNEMIKDQDVPQLLADKLTEWAYEGIAPTEAEKQQIELNVIAAVNAILDHFGFEIRFSKPRN